MLVIVTYFTYAALNQFWCFDSFDMWCFWIYCYYCCFNSIIRKQHFQEILFLLINLLFYLHLDQPFRCTLIIWDINYRFLVLFLIKHHIQISNVLNLLPLILSVQVTDFLLICVHLFFMIQIGWKYENHRELLYTISFLVTSRLRKICMI